MPFGEDDLDDDDDATLMPVEVCIGLVAVWLRAFVYLGVAPLVFGIVRAIYEDAVEARSLLDGGGLRKFWQRGLPAVPVVYSLYAVWVYRRRLWRWRRVAVAAALLWLVPHLAGFAMKLAYHVGAGRYDATHAFSPGYGNATMATFVTLGVDRFFLHHGSVVSRGFRFDEMNYRLGAWYLLSWVAVTAPPALLYLPAAMVYRWARASALTVRSWWRPRRPHSRARSS
jgi:hypothetical protein